MPHGPAEGRHTCSSEELRPSPGANSEEMPPVDACVSDVGGRWGASPPGAPARVCSAFSRVRLFCDPVDCSPAGFSVCGISQARIPQCVGTPSSGVSLMWAFNPRPLCLLRWHSSPGAPEGCVRYTHREAWPGRHQSQRQELEEVAGAAPSPHAPSFLASPM